METWAAQQKMQSDELELKISGIDTYIKFDVQTSYVQNSILMRKGEQFFYSSTHSLLINLEKLFMASILFTSGVYKA